MSEALESPETLRFRIDGMDCASCASKIETAVRRVPGVTAVSVSVAARSLKVAGGPGVGPAVIERAVGRLGYEIARAGSAQAHDHRHDEHAHAHASAEDEEREGPWWRGRSTRFAGLCSLAVAAAWIVGRLVPQLDQWAFIAAAAVGLVPIGNRAIRGALSGSPFTIETLMTIAAVGAVIIGAAEEAAVVIVLFVVGEMLEGVATARALGGIRSFTALVPQDALLIKGGGTERVPASALNVGSVILVRPGDRVPADGRIVEGSSAIDESPVTGESVPRQKGAGDEVFAGTLNADGVLKVRVSAAAADNTIARVVRLVEEAQEAKAPTERFIERFARYYTPGVIVAAALVAVLPPLMVGAEWGVWVYRGLAILLIGCPCALVISTPAAIAAGLSAGARRGLLLKGGAVLERLRGVTAVAFDKTGTLTTGRPTVTDVVLSRSAAQGVGEQRLMSMAAALEAGSSHPLATAILARAKATSAPVPPAFGVAAVPGKGVEGSIGRDKVLLGSLDWIASRVSLSPEDRALAGSLSAEGKTIALVATSERLVGMIAMRDEPRADAAEGVDALKRLGVKSVMLTGDNRATADAVAASLGLMARSELLPEDKQRIVRELQASGEFVAKVGDGINDAPALAAAEVGVAMGGGTDVALETADAAVLHGRVLDVARMIALSRRTMGNIRQNLSIALGLKAAFLVTTVIGVTGLWPAILADTGATVLVTLNALRLLRPGRLLPGER